MSEFVTIDIPQGKLRGKKVTSPFNGITYYSFQGIPYAKPPIGPLRFKPPVDPENWTGIRDATADGANSLQSKMRSNEIGGSEDCLFLNVHTPQLQATSPKAVMVWIHGGGFVVGSGSTKVHGPDFLVAEDVILVTINYRLGALGFLYLEGSDITGNNGLRDQVMALKWVKKNIAHFGGDPGNVTIFGQSGGGACVHLLTLSPQAAGLFLRVIAQSGTAFLGDCYVPRDVTSRRASRIARLLGCTSEDVAPAAEFLRRVPAETFVASKEKAESGDELHLALADSFYPCEESGPDAFFPDSPRKLLESGRYSKVPIIMGMNSAEGKAKLSALVARGKLSDVEGEKFVALLPPELVRRAGSENSEEVAKAVKKFYFGDKHIGEETFSEFIDFHSDLEFVYPVHHVAKKQARWPQHHTYVYLFDHESPQAGAGGMVPAAVAALPGVCHGGEMPYVFQGPLKPHIEPGSLDAEVRDKMVKLWTQFAMTGNPSNDAVNVTWAPVTRDNMCYLKIKGGFYIENDMYKRRMDFWEELYNKVFSQ